MLELKNNTPLNVELFPGLDKFGYDYAIVVIKAKFNMTPNSTALKFSDEPATIYQGDEYYEEPGKSSVRFGSDVSLLKRATDVVLNGRAYAPGKKPAQVIDVSVSFASQTKTCRVFGDRIWEKTGTSWGYTGPTSFEQMPLKYENAYGGIDNNEANDAVASFSKANPVGKGFIDIKSNGPKSGQALPNIEDPRTLIQHWKDQPSPVGFGFISPDWQPRAGLTGTYDDQWQSSKMPLLPEDFDDSFFNSAHPDMVATAALKGGELFSLKNVTESGDLSFQLPIWDLPITASIKGKSTSFTPSLDTVLIEPDEQSVYLSWRSTIPCYRQFLYINSVSVGKKRVS